MLLSSRSEKEPTNQLPEQRTEATTDAGLPGLAKPGHRCDGPKYQYPKAGPNRARDDDRPLDLVPRRIRLIVRHRGTSKNHAVPLTLSILNCDIRLRSSV